MLTHVIIGLVLASVTIYFLHLEWKETCKEEQDFFESHDLQSTYEKRKQTRRTRMWAENFDRR